MSNKSGASEQIISLPSGGGAMQGIGEKFSPDLHTGTGNFTVPIALPPGRNGFQPQLNLVYSTGNGNGLFGLGWGLSIPGVSRKTSQGVPQYHDYDTSEKPDVFILSGAEDLVPVDGAPAHTQQYRPRTEGLFARIDYHHETGGNYWEVRSKDGLVSTYGHDPTDTPAYATEWAHPDVSALIARPGDPARIFAWRITSTRDPFGNRIEYLYKRSKTDQRDESNGHNSDQPLLQQIRYADFIDANDKLCFLVTVSFEYQDRPDRFSEYRAGFEIRMVERCKAVRVETHFGQPRTVREYRFIYDEQSTYNGMSLLEQIEVIGYDDDGNAYDGSDTERAQQLPPLTFGYTAFQPETRKFAPVTGAQLPAQSLANPTLELADLTGDGLPDILEMNGEVRYWRNRGRGNYDLPRSMSTAPPVQLADPGVQLMDADGDGRIDLLVTAGAAAGAYPLNFNGAWDLPASRPSTAMPSFSLDDPEVKLVDLDGDGVTDAIRSGSRLECFFYDRYQGWQELRAFERKALQDFPNVSFSDSRVKWGDMTGDNLQDIVLVYDGNVEYWPNLGHGQWGKRIHMQNSPKFGDDGYTFGYDPRRILLGDVDGDGLADIVYVGDCQVMLWINQCGNAWRDPIVIQGTPPVTDLDAVRLVDLLGTGVSGMLWSADANGNGRPHMYFLDFTGGVKPYVLNKMDNHMGATTKVKYAPSAKFYLEDAAKPSTRWKTTLPFPVQVVERVEVIDDISRGKLTTQYRYHHGYWDGAEREFRGFGMVEQLDSETFDQYNSDGLHGDTIRFNHVDDDTAGGPSRKQFFSPPTLTRTWFHQGPIGPEFGEWQRDLDLSATFWDGDSTVLNLWEHIDRFLMTDLIGNRPLQRRARRDALRTLRGNILRTELYALDRYANQDRIDSELDRPYTVTESQYALVEIDPPSSGQEERKHIFFPHLVAQRTTQWERGDDPMTQFVFTDYLDENGDYDPYGRPHRITQIACPRGWRKLSDTSNAYLSTRTCTDYAKPLDPKNYYIHDRVSKTTTYEITNKVVATGRTNNAQRTILEIRDLADDGPALLVIGQTLNYYDGSAFNGQRFSQLGQYGALVRTESLVLTEEIIQQAYRNAQPPYLTPNATAWTSDYPQDFRRRLPKQAGYFFHDAASDPQYTTGYYVLTESRAYDFQIGAGRGLLTARRDALGKETTISYDPYALLPMEVAEIIDRALAVPYDALRTRAEYNYRVMQTKQVTDPNGNKTEFHFSPIGLLTETWIKGKKSAQNPEGDLQRPSVRMEYHFLEFDDTRKPIFVRTIRRIHHDTESDVPEPKRSETIESREYSDGFGRLLQTRTQGESVRFGDSILGGGESLLPSQQSAGRGGKVVGVENTNKRKPNVVVSGWQTYDNKGRVVEKHEPFFDTGWEYRSPASTQMKAKAALFYDPRGNVIRTVNPDDSEQRVIYGVPGTIALPALSDPTRFEPTPWEVYTYDANDNAERTHSSDPRIKDYQHHWNTPASMVLDALGRTAETVERNRKSGTPLPPVEEYRTSSTYDIRGNVLSVIDALGREAFGYVYDLANQPLRIESMDAGIRRVVLDAVGNEVERRDSKGALVLRAYHKLHRLTHLWARNRMNEPLTLREKLIYGDDPNSGLTSSVTMRANLLGRLFRHYDEAGLVTYGAFNTAGNFILAHDFKGNLLEKNRQVIADSAIVTALSRATGSGNGFVVDWNSPPLLEGNYQTSMTYDALNRIKSMRYPEDVDGNRQMLTPQYNRAGALESIRLDRKIYVERIAYNAKGQRVLIVYGNGVMTRYAYDPLTFRLVRLRTEKYPQPAPPLTYEPNGSPLQDFAYEYDLAGNILRITDIVSGSGVRNNPEASQFSALTTEVVAGDALVRRFVYDSLYRLVEATGRQAAHRAAPCTTYDPRRGGYNWSGKTSTTTPENAKDITRVYTERYTYDPAGNMLNQSRTGSATRYFGIGGFTPEQWQTKVTTFLAGQQPDWGTEGNRLTNFGRRTANQTHHFDANGNLTQENTERHFTWDHADRLIGFRNQATPSCPISVEAYYLYDAAGMRVKKWVRTNGKGAGDSITYIDGVFEYYSWKEVGQPGTKQNNRLHVMDNQSRIAILRVGDRHKDDKGPVVQYHLGDHLGSSNIVVGGTDAQNNSFINREEFYPYGETSFGSFGKKRYRYTGKERDEESGLYFHGMRYYAPWLTRWVTCDPLGAHDSLNLFVYVSCRPISHVDASGAAEGTASDANLAPRKISDEQMRKGRQAFLKGAGAVLGEDLLHATGKILVGPFGDPLEKLDLTLGDYDRTDYGIGSWNPLEGTLEEGYLADTLAGKGFDYLARGEEQKAYQAFGNAGYRYGKAILKAVDLGQFVAGTATLVKQAGNLIQAARLKYNMEMGLKFQEYVLKNRLKGVPVEVEERIATKTGVIRKPDFGIGKLAKGEVVPGARVAVGDAKLGEIAFDEQAKAFVEEAKYTEKRLLIYFTPGGNTPLPARLVQHAEEAMVKIRQVAVPWVPDWIPR